MGRAETGRRGEDAACRYLAARGHVILERNWRSGHLEIDIISLAQDGRYHVSVSNADNKNPTLVNGERLADGDVVGIKHGDILTLCETRLEFVGNPVEDRTELNVNKK